MKKVTKLVSVILCIAMLLGMTVTVNAEGSTVNITDLSAGTYTAPLTVVNNTDNTIFWYGRSGDGTWTYIFTTYDGGDFCFINSGESYTFSSSPSLIIESNGCTPDPDPAPGHVHTYAHKVIVAPSDFIDGLEGDVCTSRGHKENVHPISAMAYLLEKYAKIIDNAKPGDTIILDFGIWNSYPQYFMEKVSAKAKEGVSFVFNYEWKKELMSVNIPAGTVVDTSFEWYGPAKMQELYGLL